MAKFEYAFIGSILPPSMLDKYELAQSATIQTQVSLVNALIENGSRPDVIFTTLPIKRFPADDFQTIQHPALAFSELADKTSVQFLGWNNLEPLKTISIGLDGFFQFRKWCKYIKRSGKKPIALMYNLGPTHHMAPFFLMAARLSGAKLVSLVTDLEPRKFSLKGILAWLSYKIQRWSLKLMDGLLPLNENVVRDLNYEKPWNQLFGILPSDAFARKLSQLPISSGKDKTFLFSGSLNEVRGIALLLEAFYSWKDSEARLLITGRGEMDGLVREFVKKDARIKFLGFLKSEEDLLEVYSQASYVVNPHLISHSGARYIFPSKLTEYMASGRYVVSSNQGEIGSEYGDLMSIYFEDSAQLLADKLKEAVEMDVMHRINHAEKARKRVLEKQLWQHHAAKISHFLDNITSQKW